MSSIQAPFDLGWLSGVRSFIRGFRAVYKKRKPSAAAGFDATSLMRQTNPAAEREPRLAFRPFLSAQLLMTVTLGARRRRRRRASRRVSATWGMWSWRKRSKVTTPARTRCRALSA